MVCLHRTGRNAGVGYGSAPPRDSRGSGCSGRHKADRRARLRADWQHAGCMRGLVQDGEREMDTSHPSSRHQGGQLNNGFKQETSVSNRTCSETGAPAAAAAIRLALAYQVSHALYVATRLGVWDLLAAGICTVPEIASRTSTRPVSMQRLLRAL